jgi:Tfp pilus assembly protein PilO
MKGSDKGIILGVVFALVLAGFYFKVLSPKREEASKLKEEVAKLNSEIDVQEQNAAYGEDARQHFPAYYGRMVVLGKAVPAQADTASLLVELNSISRGANVKFNGLELSQGSSASGSSAGATPTGSASSGTSTTPSASGTSTTPGTSGTSPASSSATPTAAASATTPATEASAASVPLGASVGPAGLHTLPYTLNFTGTFFDVANFFSGLDSLNDLRAGGAMVAADGRLITVGGFSLSRVEELGAGSPLLNVGLAVTTYVAPSGEGLTAGASPGGPAPSVGQPTAQTTSVTVSP